MATNQRPIQTSSTRPRDKAKDPLDRAKELIVGVLAKEKYDGKSRKMLATALHDIGNAQSSIERICGVLRKPVSMVFFILSLLAVFASLITIAAKLLK